MSCFLPRHLFPRTTSLSLSLRCLRAPSWWGTLTLARIAPYERLISKTCTALNGLIQRCSRLFRSFPDISESIGVEGLQIHIQSTYNISVQTLKTSPDCPDREDADTTEHKLIGVPTFTKDTLYVFYGLLGAS